MISLIPRILKKRTNKTNKKLIETEKDWWLPEADSEM